MPVGCCTFEVGAWSGDIENESGDPFDDSQGVGSGCMDNGDVASGTRWEVEVVQGDASTGDDFEIGCAIQKGLVDLCVCADDEGICFQEEAFKAGVI